MLSDMWLFAFVRNLFGSSGEDKGRGFREWKEQKREALARKNLASKKLRAEMEKLNSDSGMIIRYEKEVKVWECISKKLEKDGRKMGYIKDN